MQSFETLDFDALRSHLETSSEKLSAKDQEFASSLLESIWRRGSPTDKQLYWVRELCKRTQPKVRETVELGSLEGINALFNRASAALKRPAIVLEADNTPIRLSVAGPDARVPGSINVTSNGSFEDRTWFGRILADGRFEVSPRVTPPASLIATLKRFASEPALVAAEYGRKTGSCCFCARELTDGRSVSVGYGPVCAERYGLPWGEAQAA
jgi:hypothetical protein